MAVTDPISDYLTRLRNAMKAKHKTVDIVASKLKIELSKVLLENNFIQHYTILENNSKKTIRVYISYYENSSVIKGLKRVSKPGIRRYVGHDGLPRVINGLGISIISTSKGLMTEKQARQLGIGGEVLCYVW
jgi:small subunit ribosomal protein S8